MRKLVVAILLLLLVGWWLFFVVNYTYDTFSQYSVKPFSLNPRLIEPKNFLYEILIPLLLVGVVCLLVFALRKRINSYYLFALGYVGVPLAYGNGAQTDRYDISNYVSQEKIFKSSADLLAFKDENPGIARMCAILKEFEMSTATQGVIR